MRPQSGAPTLRSARRGFTLIELLVVIAIIAILAAILFPVFAKAREKARQMSDLSDEKQIALAILQYVQDHDEAYPTDLDWQAPPGAPGVPGSWVGNIDPYIKSYAAFLSPEDNGGNSSQAWLGAPLSFAANGYMTWAARGPNFTQGMVGLDAADGWSHKLPNVAHSVILASVPKPSSTILLCDKYSQDVLKMGDAWVGRNPPSFDPIRLMMADDQVGGAFYQGEGDQIPDGHRPGATADGLDPAYPNGPSGGVSSHFAGGQANFAFADGHVKTMRPVATNPDGVNCPANNLWDALRPDSNPAGSTCSSPS